MNRHSDKSATPNIIARNHRVSGRLSQKKEEKPRKFQASAGLATAAYRDTCYGTAASKPAHDVSPTFGLARFACPSFEHQPIVCPRRWRETDRSSKAHSYLPERIEDHRRWREKAAIVAKPPSPLESLLPFFAPAPDDLLSLGKCTLFETIAVSRQLARANNSGGSKVGRGESRKAE